MKKKPKPQVREVPAGYVQRKTSEIFVSAKKGSFSGSCTKYIAK